MPPDATNKVTSESVPHARRRLHEELDDMIARGGTEGIVILRFPEQMRAPAAIRHVLRVMNEAVRKDGPLLIIALPASCTVKRMAQLRRRINALVDEA